MARKKSDPLLSALISRLPPSGTEWPVENQTAWLRLMAVAFGLLYGGDAESQLGARETIQNPPVRVKPFRSIEYSFYIDNNGYARKTGGQRIVPDEVKDTLHDLRGIDGDVADIIWADDSKGLSQAGPI